MFPAILRLGCALLLVLATTLLGACTVQVKSDVTRFHENALPRGETIRVVAAGPAAAADLEFRHYADMVAGHLKRIGYTPVAGDAPAQLTATLAWSVADKDTITRSRPDTFVSYHFAWGHYHDPWYFGVHDAWEDEVYTYVVYHRDVSVVIADPAGKHLFEGRVHSAGREREISQVMPYLLTALFSNYPGESGVTKLVTIRRDDIDE
jgi:hypothetical protein